MRTNDPLVIWLKNHRTLTQSQVDNRTAKHDRYDTTPSQRANYTITPRR